MAGPTPVKVLREPPRCRELQQRADADIASAAALQAVRDHWTHDICTQGRVPRKLCGIFDRQISRYVNSSQFFLDRLKKKQCVQP